MFDSTIMTEKSKSLAVLMTVHNRKQKTLSCLSHLFGQLVPQNLIMDLWLTDDGCTDGTLEAVVASYPQVKIISGDGNLFWNRGMYKAWEKASQSRDYDYYLWLNDDTELLNTCISELVSDAHDCSDTAIIVACIRSKIKEIATYGGRSMQGTGVVNPNGSLQECATMNGNCVLIPKAVFNVCGNLDWTFHHAIGDMDYGYRARKAGFRVLSSRNWLGYCENNPKLPAWARKEVPFGKRIKNLYSPLGYAEPIPFFHYEKRNFGLFTALKHFVTIHIRVLFPGLWK